MNNKCILNKNHLICRDPLVFNCLNENEVNHLACYECIDKQSDYSGTFKCNLCQNEHKKDSLEKFELKIGNFSMPYLKETLSNSIQNGNKLNSELKNKKLPGFRERLIRNFIEYIEHNLMVRVESLKFEFDDLEDSLNEKIDSYRLKQLGENTQVRDKLEKIVEKNSNISKHTFFMLKKCKLYEENFISLKEIFNLNNFKPNGKKSVFDLKKNLPIKSTMGFLQGPMSVLSIEKRLKIQPNVSLIDLNCFIKSSCGLAEIYDGKKIQLAMTDYASNDIKIMTKYDSYSLKEIDIVSIERFRLNKFKCYYAICSNFDLNSLTGLEDDSTNVYACDMELHRVLIFDQKISKIRRIITEVPNEYSNDLEEFECPRDICYFNGYFYVLDQGKNVVNIFRKNGDFYKNFYFNKKEKKVENPWSVRVSNNLLFIINWKESVFVYDFEFNLKYVLDIESVLSMCVVNDYDKQRVYAFFHCENGHFIGYKISNDEQKPEIIFQSFFKNLKYRSEFMIFTSDQKFVISLGWSKLLATIDFF
ncbi:unnamed protein product [Brachionus calyciflorus]|uniref:B box-type domain-containing protein n=1 Tax=Brachionus calyciflorus TaxID=104777 RepID=A0A814IAV2_9BILA|nr:unnamed protein product [Brachionus calyciflorus]